MKTIEFNSKIINNTIQIPRKIQSEFRMNDEKNVRVMIFLEDSDVNDGTDLLDSGSEEGVINLTKEELDSINNGLKDFEEGRTHSHETARKLYERYL